jgi:SAM-dependent methyltransferase
MEEILKHLPAGSFVLDLGCARGSFAREATPGTVIRFDQDVPPGINGEMFVQGDAANLPFPDRTFAAIISNHSLEHFNDLEGSLREIGRVVHPGGAIFVSAPDASTFTDKLYRWLAGGGGHVNPFTSPDELASMIERATGLRHLATRTLCSSLSFLNRRNSPPPRPRRLLFLGAGYEWSLFLYTWLSRRIDRLLSLRTSIYGWALYFGEVSEPIDTVTSVNVCIRCGSGSPAFLLNRTFAVRASLFRFRTYGCPHCGATNPFADD